jgi:hypothetical protein
MSAFNDRSKRAGNYIPKGSTSQGVFKAVACNAIGRGVGIDEAIAHAAHAARREDPDFVPTYDVAILSI